MYKIILVFVFMMFLHCNTFATEYKFAAVVKGLNSDYWHSVAAGLESAANKYNIDIETMGPSSETQVMLQYNIVQDQITKGTDALILAPIRPESMKTILEQAYKNKIPVVCIDTDCKWDKEVSFVGTDNFDSAKVAGEYINTRLKGKGNIVIIRGAKGDYVHDERTKGFLGGIKNSSIKVLTIQAANSERGTAFNVMQNILQVHKKNIDALFATNDEMALGALMSLKASNIKKSILVIGFDATPDAIKSILKGGLIATVKQDAYGIGYKGVEIAYEYLKGKKVSKYVPIPTQIIDRNNVIDEVKNLIKIFGKEKIEKLFGKKLMSQIKSSNE